MLTFYCPGRYKLPKEQARFLADAELPLPCRHLGTYGIWIYNCQFRLPRCIEIQRSNFTYHRKWMRSQLFSGSYHVCHSHQRDWLAIAAPVILLVLHIQLIGYSNAISRAAFVSTHNYNRLKELIPADGNDSAVKRVIHGWRRVASKCLLCAASECG